MELGKTHRASLGRKAASLPVSGPAGHRQARVADCRWPGRTGAGRLKWLACRHTCAIGCAVVRIHPSPVPGDRAAVGAALRLRPTQVRPSGRVRWLGRCSRHQGAWLQPGGGTAIPSWHLFPAQVAGPPGAAGLQ
ncbi:prolyl-tRNA synthetase domain-containing protein [Xanthomonas citri pv. glycines str. 8ra]|nr:prolyl-tRNA synthetase domain-containing protein [Xanthomonas citri pv. glycines str. 8ra]